MKVVILCGGFGVRIRDVSEDIPKPMIPIGPYPILWHIMKYYASFGFNDFILCLGYKGEVIKDFFANYETRTKDFTVVLGEGGGFDFHTNHQEADWSVTLVDTGLNSATGSRVRKVRRYLEGEEEFMLTYGDGVGDVDLHKLLAFHRRHRRVLTVTAVHPPGRFGELTTNAEGLVQEFNEKPQAREGRISGGFFVCRRELFDYLDERDDLVFEVEPMDKLVASQQLYAYVHDGFWQPMDTRREFLLLNEYYESGEAPWVTWQR